MTGLIGNPGGYHAVRDCDVLVMLGTDFTYEWFLPEKAKIIQRMHPTFRYSIPLCSAPNKQ